MTNNPSGQGINASTTSTAGGKGRIAGIMFVAITFVVAAIVGGYLDWIWWPVAHGGGLSSPWLPASSCSRAASWR